MAITKPEDFDQYIRKSGARFLCSICDQYSGHQRRDTRHHIESVYYPTPSLISVSSVKWSLTQTRLSLDTRRDITSFDRSLWLWLLIGIKDDLITKDCNYFLRSVLRWYMGCSVRIVRSLQLFSKLCLFLRYCWPWGFWEVCGKEWRQKLFLWIVLCIHTQSTILCLLACGGKTFSKLVHLHMSRMPKRLWVQKEKLFIITSIHNTALKRIK